ncbi:MAG: hypothetical protein LQ346_004130 [Caloplaca aetnensis]|nr:MAG: hypothetical protein LQ346_004130 [Caloplaca aetnensis]
MSPPPSTSPIALNATASHGIETTTSTFDPAEEPYKHSSSAGHLFFAVYPDDAEVQGEFRGIRKLLPDIINRRHIPTRLLQQRHEPTTFGNNTALCDQKIRFWNTTLSQGFEKPENVVGNLILVPSLVHRKETWMEVKGIRASQAVL